MFCHMSFVTQITIRAQPFHGASHKRLMWWHFLLSLDHYLGKNRVEESVMVVKRNESCVTLYRGAPVLAHLQIVEQAVLHIRIAPGETLPSLFDVVLVTRPIHQYVHFSPLLPLGSLQGLPLLCGMESFISYLLTHLIPKLAEGHPLPLYLLASSRDQPPCLGYDHHPIFSSEFCSFQDLGHHFVIKSHFL